MGSLPYMVEGDVILWQNEGRPERFDEAKDDGNYGSRNCLNNRAQSEHLRAWAESQLDLSEEEYNAAADDRCG